MKKKLFVALFCVILFCTGCSNQETYNNVEWKSLSEEVCVYNITNEKICMLECSTSTVAMLADEYAIYFRSFTDDNNEVKCEFYSYNFKTTENLHLATLYGAKAFASDRVYVNGCVYILVTFGEETIDSLPNGEVWKIDLKNSTMSKLFDAGPVSPRSLMAAVDDKILFSFLTYDGNTIMEYDTGKDKRRVLKNVPFDNEKVKGIAPVKISVNENTISFLLLDCRSMDDFSLRAEVYDYNFNRLSTHDMSFLSDRPNELKTTVKTFTIIDDLVYYRNNSSTKFLGTFDGEKLSIESEDEETELVKSFDQSSITDTHVFISVDEDNYVVLYSLDGATKEMKKARLDFCGQVQMASVRRDDENNVLVNTQRQDKKTKKWVSAHYYFNLSEINFE